MSNLLSLNSNLITYTLEKINFIFCIVALLFFNQRTALNIVIVIIKVRKIFSVSEWCNDMVIELIKLFLTRIP